MVRVRTSGTRVDCSAKGTVGERLQALCQTIGVPVSDQILELAKGLPQRRGMRKRRPRNDDLRMAARKNYFAFIHDVFGQLLAGSWSHDRDLDVFSWHVPREPDDFAREVEDVHGLPHIEGEH